jgi:hypothetical protein
MMLWLSGLWRNMVHRDRTEDDLDDEVRGTPDMLIAEAVNQFAYHELPDEIQLLWHKDL